MRTPFKRFLELVSAVAVLTGLGATDPPMVVVELSAGAHDRSGTPIVVPLPEALATFRSFSLTRLDDNRSVDVQFLPGEAGERPSVAWIVRGPLASGSTRRYKLRPAPSSGSRQGVAVVDDRRQLQIEVDGKPVLRYQVATVEPPAGLAAHYRRSGQMHPLLTPTGRAVTDDFPPDHAHQHGIFLAWVNTTFDGRHVDFWNQAGQTGSVSHVETLGSLDGPVLGQFRVRLRHDDLSAPGGTRTVLNEIWTVRAYRLSDAFVVDFRSEQTCASRDALTINRYHYGGFGLRGNRAWFDRAAKGSEFPDPSKSGRSDFLTSDGKRRRDGNHSRPRWVDLSGEVGGMMAGVTVLGDPGNFQHPQPVRLHPNKPYFCFAPMVLGEFAIVPGKPYVSRYRLIVHDGPPDPRALERYWNDYADPPRVSFGEVQ